MATLVFPESACFAGPLRAMSTPAGELNICDWLSGNSGQQIHRLQVAREGAYIFRALGVLNWGRERAAETAVSCVPTDAGALKDA